MAHEETAPTLYGLMAEFDTPDALLHAAESARLAGYRVMDAYSPIPIEELSEALGLARTRLPKLVFLGGLLGFGNITMPSMLSTVTGEDIKSTWP